MFRRFYFSLSILIYPTFRVHWVSFNLQFLFNPSELVGFFGLCDKLPHKVATQSHSASFINVFRYETNDKFPKYMNDKTGCHALVREFPPAQIITKQMLSSKPRDENNNVNYQLHNVVLT